MLDLAIWAHSLQGDLKKALWHYRWIKENKVKLPAESWAAIHFALGVAYTRVSEYAKAREQFGAIAAISARIPPPDSFCGKGWHSIDFLRHLIRARPVMRNAL